MFSASKISTPSGGGPDAQFNYVTMLLHGDGTNGAGNISFKDSSTTNFAMSSSGNATQGSFSPYGSNWSNYFDGSKYLVSDDIGIIAQSYSEWTVECFVFVTGTSNNQKFTTQGTTGNVGRFSLGIEGGNWWVQIGSNTVQTGTPVRNQWNYVAVTYDSTILKLYVNGSLIGSVSTTQKIQNTTFRVGTDWNNYYTTGYISNVRVSNEIRTVTTIPTAPFTDISNVALLICQSNRFKDSSGYGWLFTDSVFPSVERFNPFGTATAYSTSVIGGSGFFPSGTSDYIYTNTNLAAIGTSNFTVEGWWYPLVASKQEFCLFSVGDVTVSTGFAIASDTASGIFIYSGNYYLNSSTLGIPQLNAWNHIAVTRSGATLTLFMNGVQISTGSWGSHNIGANPIYIGSAANGYFSETNGYISNVRYTNTLVYSGSTYTVPTAPLTAISGTGFLAKFDNAGVLDNAMMNDLRIGGDVVVSTSVKKFGTGSMFFDGFGSYLTTTHTPNLNLGASNWTIECWVYLTSTTGERTIIAKGRDLAGGLWWWLDGTSLNVRLRNSSSGFVDITATSALTSTSTWYHVAVVRNSNTVTMYVNGTSVASGTYSSSLVSTYDFEVGAYNAGTSSFKGYIDDLRVTKGYARTITVPTSALPDTGPI
jgi:hypothetical protein